MNPHAESLIDGLLQFEADVGATITWNGADYPCCAGENVTAKMLGAGGFGLTAAVTVILRAAVLALAGAQPDVGQKIIYRSDRDADPVTLKVAPQGVNDLYGEILILSLADPAQGA